MKSAPRSSAVVSAPRISSRALNSTGASATVTSFGLHDTSHYLAPVIAWNLPSDWTLRLSPGFGLNDNSHRFLLRWGVSREFSGFGSAISRLFGGRS